MIITISLTTSCKKAKQTDPIDTTNALKTTWAFDTLSYNNKVSKNTDSSSIQNIDLELVYPTKYTNDSIVAKVQKIFFKSFIEEVDHKQSIDQEFKEYTNKCITEFKILAEDAKEDNDDFSEYYKTRKTFVYNTNNLMITGCTQNSEYTGGAHGSHFTEYFNISLKDGSLITIDSLFNNNSINKELKDLINQRLSTAKNGNGDNITLLKDTPITPSNNFYFNKDGIVFVYNRYEIAPYSDGLIEVGLPYNKIQDLLNKPYNELTNSIQIKIE